MLAAAFGAALSAPGVGQAATYTVNTTVDGPAGCSADHCTLSEAIAASNASVGVRDTIAFAIPGPGPHSFDGGLKTTDPVTIDGATQVGGAIAQPCSAPAIEIRATVAPGAARGSYPEEGLTITDRTTLRCLSIVGFTTQLSVVGDDNIVQGNYIGLDSSGSIPSVIGGVQRSGDAAGWGMGGIGSPEDLEPDRNLIADNVVAGIGGMAFFGVHAPEFGSLITLRGTQNIVRGNRLGTTPDGRSAATLAQFGGFGTTGIVVIGTGNVIGGTNNTPEGPCSGDCNLISVGRPIAASGANHVIEGNFIGTDVTGSRVLGPLTVTSVGIELGTVVPSVALSNSRIGGPNPNQRNLISVNSRQHGIVIWRGEHVAIQGNYFGTNATGTAYILPLNSSGSRISIANANDVLIGGFAGAREDRCSGACNLVSAIQDGLDPTPLVQRAVVSGLRIEGNYMGTDLTGTTKLGPGARVLLTHDATHGNSTVGGFVGLQANVIAFGSGVAVVGEGTRPGGDPRIAGCAQPEPCPGVTILSNRIFENNGPGINFSAHGVAYPAPNDDGDIDVGPNDVQNFPVIESVNVAAGQTTIHGFLSSKPNHPYELQFFRNRTCDQTHFYGEGERPIQPINPPTFVSTDASGRHVFSYTFPFALAPDEVITATATDGTPGLVWTSGFSQCRADVSIVKRASAATVKVGELLTYTLTVRNAGPSPAYATKVIDTLPDGVALEGSPTSTKGSCAVTSPVRVDCSLGDLGREEVATITIAVRPQRAGKVNNSATVDWAGMRLFPTHAFDPVPSNNSDRAETLVDEDATGTLVVTKATVPAGAPTSFDFTVSGGLSPSNFNLRHGESRRFDAIPARSGYSLAEALPNGWQLTAACSDGSPITNITVDPRETVECVFTNVKLATLIVRKETVPAGATTVFPFGAGGGLAPASFALSGGGSRTFANVIPRAGYSVAESAPAGWTQTHASCDDGSSVSNIALDPGEAVTCTFRNVLVLPPGGGTFVIGDRNAAIGSSVTFWGAQWWTLNTLSGSVAPAAFKGFALNPNMPTCGATWATDPGNSAPPPRAPLPAHIGVIVADSARQSGLMISGPTLQIVVVATNPGYDPNVGHPGTGTVVSRVC